MSIFKPAEHSQAYLKAGLMGLQGSGKTYTATELAIGLVEYMRKRGLPDAEKPVAFFDTETGSDWMLPRFKEAGIQLVLSRSRSLVDLRKGIDEATGTCSVLLIDSITHFWTRFVEEYVERSNRRWLEFSDWNFLKKEWRGFTDLYVNAPLHCIMCGRQGYEYDYFEKEDGKSELQKTGVKMKAESETGYEPSILIMMESRQRVSEEATAQQGRGRKKKAVAKLQVSGIDRIATVLKDRSQKLDGKRFTNPTFADFLPHVECLAFGASHAAIEQRDNSELFAGKGEQTKYAQARQEKEVVLEEISEKMKQHYAGQDAGSKTARGDLMQKFFGTRAWSRIETMALIDLQKGRDAMWLQLDGVPYAFVPPDTSKILQPGANDPPKTEAAA
ncbi:MAG TPA: AAA family ATPase [Steroidobacteraceae bacterium]|nr:AAA family ATPase [Steroidobacteraceae bacterium]